MPVHRKLSTIAFTIPLRLQACRIEEWEEASFLGHDVKSLYVRVHTASDLDPDLLTEVALVRFLCSEVALPLTSTQCSTEGSVHAVCA